MSASGTHIDIKAALDLAARAASEGRGDEEARQLAIAQSAAPEHPLVRNALGVRALRLGDARAARDHLDRAVAVDATSPAIWLNLALACKALNDAAAELEALDAALAIDPYFYLALLQKAMLFERQDNAKKAAGLFNAFLLCVPRNRQLPPSLKAAAQHAQQAVEANQKALDSHLRNFVSQSREQHADARLDRFDFCLDVLTGRKRVFVQQPTFMHFPQLPAIEFYDRELFPWMEALEASTDAIRQELLQLFADTSAGFQPYVANPAGTPLNQWKELDHSLNWSAYYLWRESEPVADHLARCPRTAAALQQIPRADVPGHGPTAFFSVLKPRTRIPPHTGVSNTRLVVHLPLIVPPGCGFRVGADVRQWEPGKAWVFDDTIEHEAWNDSDELRGILIFDIWNPFLTEAERALVRAATVGVAQFYGEESPLKGAL